MSEFVARATVDGARFSERERVSRGEQKPFDFYRDIFWKRVRESLMRELIAEQEGSGTIVPKETDE